MFFTSTRDNNVKVTASKAIADGISPDGGLYIPEAIPQLSAEEIKALCDVSYIERAKKVLGLYLTDFTKEELSYCVEGAYKAGKFNSPFVAPVVNLHDNVNILELFRGPTCAFKDMALQILPYHLTVSAKKNLKDKEIVILVAT
jgi:threonine synthase